MSVDSKELQRATLERKKSDELNVIATALGLRAGSRMKKADLVALILDATGAADASAAEGRGAGAASLSPAVEATEVTLAPVDAPRSSPGSGWPGDEADGDVSPVESRPAPTSLFDTPSAAQARHAAESERGRVERAPSERTPLDRSSSGRSEPVSGGASDTAEPSADADGAEQPAVDDESGRFDGEGTGRRRRRRGRDRDRTDRPERPDRPDRPDRVDRPERVDRVERPDRPERPERNDRPERPERNLRDRDDNRDRGEESTSEPVAISGYLDLRDEGYGFLRINGSFPSRDDAYVSVRQVRQLGLRKGDFVVGASRPAGHKEKNPALLRIDAVNGDDPELARLRPRFEDLTPLFPDTKLLMEVRDDPYNMTARIIDLMSPIGKGQRGLIVSPPKAGKTTIMKQIARSIEINNPDVHLIVLLVDERPEEVTDMKRWLTKGEVAASTFDRPAEEHIQVAELTIERAKRLVETGKDVCIILDGITRLARAYNLGAPATGRIMSGGIDTGALYPPKKFFGAARNVEEGGSLTILATALVETGSRMDEVIFEEFKGTGNMELRLDRRLAERRIYPAIDVEASSTRHEELLFERKQLQQVWKLRRVLSALRGEGEGPAAGGLELLIDRLKSFRNNEEFLAEVAKGPAVE